MSLKTNLTYLSILIGLVLFSNQVGYAQIENAAIIYTDANRNTKSDIYKLQVENVNQYDLCLGLTSKQTLQKFYAEIRNKKLGLKESARNYYAYHLERNAVNKNKTYLNDASPTLPRPSYQHTALSQDPGKPVETKEFYLHKAKNKNTTAWILMGGGTAMAVVGIIGFGANFDIWSTDQAQTNRTDIFGFMILTGIVADLVSIPFFIGSHYNKKIASMVSLGNQNIHSPLMSSYSMISYPTLTLKVNF